MIHTIVKWLSQVCEVISIFTTTLLIVKSISSGMISTISFTQSDSPSAITVLITYSLNRIQFFIFIQRQHNNEVRTEMAALTFHFTHSLDFFNLLLLILDYCICLYLVLSSCILIPHGLIQSDQRNGNMMFLTLCPSSSPFLTPIRMISPFCLLSYQ